MSKRDFLRENRLLIDEVAQSRGCKTRLNDKDRWEWVLNDETLYNYAIREGVRCL